MSFVAPSVSQISVEALFLKAETTLKAAILSPALFTWQTENFRTIGMDSPLFGEIRDLGIQCYSSLKPESTMRDLNESVFTVRQLGLIAHAATNIKGKLTDWKNAASLELGFDALANALNSYAKLVELPILGPNGQLPDGQTIRLYVPK